jgi:hypothetical protein
VPIEEPPALHDRALDHLIFIRETMARAASFTHVPGWGGVAMGVTGLLAAAAAEAADQSAWLAIWLTAAAVGSAIGLAATIRKTRRAGVPLTSGAGRVFVRTFTPSLVAGAVLTAVLGARGQLEPLPGIWLLLYGTGIVSGGANSVRAVPLMGGAFMALGACALAAPPRWGNTFMAMGFGVLQVGFGLFIARKYGG